ncbi:MAG: transporter substrate-binding domain-containing protein [Syntrophales bacterium]|nr:transporter substrate-binding domain-containing protein [Syntrophales bacterium]
MRRLIFIYSIIFLISMSDPSLADLKEVRERGVLRHLGIPYAKFVTGTGEGMDVDIMRLFANHLGVRYEFVKTDWHEVFGDLTGFKVKPKGKDEVEFIEKVPIKGDVAASGITVLPWREKIVSFSKPLFPNQVWAVTRKDSPMKPIISHGNVDRDIEATRKTITGKTIMGKFGTCLDPHLYGLEIIAGKLVDFPGSINDIAPAVLEGKAEVALLDLPDALVALQRWPGLLKIIGPVSDKQYMAAAFSKDAPQLKEEFDRFLAKLMNDGRYHRIVKKYYPHARNFDPEFFKKTRKGDL